MPLLYDIGLGLYQLGIRAAAPFKPKARAWCDGRKDLWQRLELSLIHISEPTRPY